jgi:hypothetical protein
VLVRSDEQIGARVTPAISDPALQQMPGAIMQQMTALAEAGEVAHPVVAWIVVDVRGGEHDARDPLARNFPKVGPTRRFAAAITPRRHFVIEPAPVGKAANEGKVWSATTLALAFSAVEANPAAQFPPVRGIEWS